MKISILIISILLVAQGCASVNEKLNVDKQQEMHVIDDSEKHSDTLKSADNKDASLEKNEKTREDGMTTGEWVGFLVELSGFLFVWSIIFF